jgi:ribonuclease-3
LGKDREFYDVVRHLIGITPDNIELYKLALIHRSASVVLPDGMHANNERLEFLGDAILEAVVSDFLFIEFPDQSEGFLTRMRSRIVSRASLDEIARNIGLDKYIIANFNGSHSHKYLFGNAMEALIGAIYLDKGYDFTNRLLIDHIFRDNMDMADMTNTETDFKSRLIEWCQKSKREIKFRTGPDTGSTHKNPMFISTVIIDGIELSNGCGTSKKEAEQKASLAVTQILDDEVGDYFLDTIDTSFEKYNGNGHA